MKTLSARNKRDVDLSYLRRYIRQAPTTLCIRKNLPTRVYLKLMKIVVHLHYRTSRFTFSTVRVYSTDIKVPTNFGKHARPRRYVFGCLLFLVCPRKMITLARVATLVPAFISFQENGELLRRGDQGKGHRTQGQAAERMP